MIKYLFLIVAVLAEATSTLALPATNLRSFGQIVLTIHRLTLFSHDLRVQLLRYFLMSFIGPIQYFRATYIDFYRNTTR